MKTALLVLCLASVVSAQIIAQAIIKGTTFNPNISGKVTFTQASASSNVTVAVSLTGVTFSGDGVYGLHVHFWGDLSDYNGSTTTGTHWTFANHSAANHTIHGCPEGGPNRHLGDMGLWNVVGGVLSQTKTLDLLTLTGLESIIGRAVVLHGYPDDCITQPNGNSSTRVAHGVIGLVNATVYGGASAINADTTFPAMYAIVNLQPSASSSVNGTVWFTQNQTGVAGVYVQAQVFGISGNHGFHLHWWGDISNPNGTATGLHFNPLNSLHGIPPNKVRHMGDMGIIYTYKNGVAYYSFFNDYLSLQGPNSVIGRAVHVHANSDDCTNPIGTGGSRYAQGVVGITVPHSVTLLTSLFSDVPMTQDGLNICGNLVSTSATTAATTATTATGTATTTVASGTATGTTKIIATSAKADSPASVISVAWALFAVVFAFCL